MKKEGHPEYHPFVSLTLAQVSAFLFRSTLVTRTKEVIDGVEYYVSNRDVTSDLHPAFTGEKRFIGGLESRITKFNNRFFLRSSVA